MNDRDIDPTLSRDVFPVGVVAHYRILKRLGAGGMGEVFLAQDTKLDRPVALKFLPPLLAGNADLRTRFLREARAAAQLHHPNIVTIYEVGEHENRPYIAMQYVEGRTLSDLSSSEPLSISLAIRLVCGICEGLAKAHTARITHRDIKPANILVGEDSRPVLLDFGLASVQGDEKLTRAGSAVGTVAYMSPEQAQGLKVDARSDLFSCGIVLYELIAGHSPFRRDNEAATLHAIVTKEPEPLARFKNDVPSELQHIVSKCLAKDPNERYQSAADLLADLRSVDRSLAESSSSSRIAAIQPSVAVLPFANLSADPDNEFFSDGLTEELMNVLARNPGLKVTGRTSSFAFKGKQEDLRGIGQKLGVGAILEGSVRKAGTRLRITAQLVNANDGFHLWSQTFDRVLDDVFALQDEIARSVAEALHVKLLGKREERAIHPESYELLLRANRSAALGSESSVAVAVDLYRQSIDVDSANARAWAGLARAYTYQTAFGHRGAVKKDDLRSEARRAAERALQLDDQLPEAHDVMSWILSSFEFRFDEGAAAARRAYELAPNHPRVLATLAIIDAANGRFDEALRHSKRAIELDPLDPEVYLHRGRILLWAERYREAEKTLKRLLELSSGQTSSNALLAWALLFQGKTEEALETAQRVESAGYRAHSLAIIYHALGMKQESDQELAQLVQCGDQWNCQIASACACRGDIDQAFEWLEKAITNRDAGIPIMRTSPMLKNLHGDPRWAALLKRIGLVK
jgi:serine/threonine protein kinase/Flp pilus assembly protein TadD